MSEVEKESDKPRWKGLLRSGTNARREDRKNLFYPVLIDESRCAVVDTGTPLLDDAPPDRKTKINGLTPVWPIRTDGSLGNWGVGHTSLKKLIDKGYVSLGSYDAKRGTWPISYLSRQAQDQIQSGILNIISFDETKNVVDVRYTSEAERRIKSVWHRSLHDAGAYGADYLRKMLGERSFPFPKSIHAVRDTLAAVTKSNPGAVVLDFFAGSGTTGEAVQRINEEFGGKRSYILCTNNENGIADEVTYPRIKTVINKNQGGKRALINLTYFKTAFVSKQKTDDQTRVALMTRSTEMICFREDAFEKVICNDSYKVFEGADRYVAIVFDFDTINTLKVDLDRLLTSKPVHIYIFSLSDDTYESDFAGLARTHELRPIPESIIEVYRRIFTEKNESIEIRDD